ncbi:hypothetical protein CO057_04635 [Candidatus Uhrbacteria bacterium CG_4_9_14_0_2_um_filter_41_50]|uniref:Uncharacterized protein n=1 Tax=Candidatus Uhrbacteria bacterium CG_4_9_14_0_2_um_filter_41_50 TaxID=1975031 RepID=A0A2M8EMZ5_9BACT|nr:MAG: hypothetical protein COZ45_03425 [Candidatus Uhrbacteria bacterium CG_4_10_14_3_um_filter_41_21]PIZ54706.1 MAG: hypothetical protein COY24_02845 [Candidatus Uhrbacteria bacterium CG_4_10_14_0_2_um_filter_41_21]PJB84727.1 MAG: hypothetical protein CO086_02110 [Candidatus Uhrbacteria bacterium CG_4_9_14_0_8_um_filter_41_16]PJC24105.1 MAG: hypothetical protein CO057_04635 [Candidatus Uhrbacteria bacterium CG_4_9_14_0_2_um_filter_41_50]PJE74797.1 MAG: hypothetical protein COV03_03630 [Candi
MKMKNNLFPITKDKRLRLAISVQIFFVTLRKLLLSLMLKSIKQFVLLSIMTLINHTPQTTNS